MRAEIITADSVRDQFGRFLKGSNVNTETQFKKGQHWRKPKPFWEREWLYDEYVNKLRTEADIASQFGVTENAIWFWMRKHGIPSRTMKQIRAVKHWGAEGERNPMFGRCGATNPNWRGGTTPLRQALYSTAAWRQLVKDVQIRDKVCRLCGSSSRLQIHHIEPFWFAPLLVFTLWNVIRLCIVCHRNIRGNELRWRKRLHALVGEGGSPV
jgi:hypothetical protein